MHQLPAISNGQGMAGGVGGANADGQGRAGGVGGLNADADADLPFSF